MKTFLERETSDEMLQHRHVSGMKSGETSKQSGEHLLKLQCVAHVDPGLSQNLVSPKRCMIHDRVPHWKTYMRYSPEFETKQ